jgi:repressor LexA
MPKHQPLTPRQREVLALVEDSIARRGFPPTRAEIAQALGFRSPNAAEDHLRALQRKGAIEIEASHRGLRVPGKHRRVQRTLAAAPDAGTGAGQVARARKAQGGKAQADFVLSIPLIGRVAAGQPILAEAQIERQLQLDPALFSARPDYLLRVQGSSMRDAGILDGDLVAVQRASEARDGAMVVARIGDEATVKYFERRGARVRLLPANPDFAPIEIDLAREPLVIEGRVVGCIRTGVASGSRSGAGAR